MTDCIAELRGLIRELHAFTWGRRDALRDRALQICDSLAAPPEPSTVNRNAHAIPDANDLRRIAEGRKLAAELEGQYGPFCPACERHPQVEGHAPDCEIARLTKERDAAVDRARQAEEKLIRARWDNDTLRAELFDPTRSAK